MTRLLVFDLDGTLVDSASQIVASMHAGHAAVGRTPPSEASILTIVGLSLPLAIERLQPGIEADERDRIVDAYRAEFLADPEAPPLYPGAAAALGTLAARPDQALSVASGKTRRGIVKVLDQHGLLPLFGSLHGSDEHPSKPDPSMLRAAMAAVGVGPDCTVMIGDSLFDIQMARAAGVRSLGVSWGYYPPAELRAAGASEIVDSFGDLCAALDRIGNGA